MAKDKSIPSNLVFTREKFKYDTIEDMRNDVALKIGDVVELNGYYEAGDGADHKRKIEAQDDGSGVMIKNVNDMAVELTLNKSEPELYRVGLYANIVHNGEVNVSWFGAKGDRVTDDTEAIQKSLVYIQGISIDEDKEYTKQELEKIEQNKNKKIQKLIIDGNFRVTKKIVFTLGYEIETPAINGAYGNKEKLFGIYYDGTSDFTAFSTASFIKQENGNYKFIKSKEDIDRLIAEYDNIDSIIFNITANMIFNINLGAKEGTPVTFLFGGNQSKISGKIGMLSNSGDISTIFLRAWETKCENVHFYGAYQSVVNIKCNNSHVFKSCYFTNYRNKNFQKYRIIPTDCPWDLTNEMLNIYNFGSSSVFYNPVMEGGNYHMCSDNGSINSVFSPYFETHNPSQGTLAGFLILNNSKVDSFGGIFPKSNSGGHCVRAYNNDTSYSSYFNTTKAGSGGYLISTKNCEAEYTFDNLNTGYKNDVALCRNKSEIYKLEKIHINIFETKIIEWKPSINYVSLDASDDLEVCLWLAKERNAKVIKLMEDKTLDKEISIELSNITFDLNGKTLSIKDSNSFFDLGNNVDIISFYGGTINGTQNDTDYLVCSIVFKTINMVFEQINFVNKFMVYGGYRDCLTNSCINIYNSNLDNFTGKYIAGTTAGFKTIDNYKVYVSNKTTDKIKFTLLNSPMAILMGTDNKINVANEIQQLNTLHMGEKMKQEGVYDDFITYMDEKTSYDKQQRKISEQRQLAYEEAVKENPELTYEEFMSVQPMTLNLVEEPQPSDALKKFMEKYL